MKLSIKIFDYDIVFWIFRKQWVPRGVSSRIPHSLSHVLFLDYDNIGLEVLEDEIQMLIDVFELGDCHIIETSEGNYHVECLEYYGTNEVLMIQDASSCDAHFRRGPTLNMWRGWVHRRSGKLNMLVFKLFGKVFKEPPKYVKTLKSPYTGQRLQSDWHRETFERDFGVELDKAVNPDGGDEGYEESYETLRR